MKAGTLSESGRIRPHLTPLECGIIFGGIPAGAISRKGGLIWGIPVNSRYENILWPELLADVFPSMPNLIRKRRTISGRLNSIRGLRNRVFHYEPIWHRDNLLKQHDEILDTIAWISPSMAGLVGITDRFPGTYSLGIRGYEDLLSTYFAPVNIRYENILWPELLADVFPSMPNLIRKRRTISGRLNSIRGLRNRVFHYEPIWHRDNLLKQHDEILDTIAWISPSMAGLVGITDRFDRTTAGLTTGT